MKKLMQKWLQLKKEQHTRLEEAFSDPNTVVLAEDEMVCHPGDNYTEGLDTPGSVSGRDRDQRYLKEPEQLQLFESKDRPRDRVFYRTPDDA